MLNLLINKILDDDFCAENFPSNAVDFPKGF